MRGERVILRPPKKADWRAWASLRAGSRDHLQPFEPTWGPAHLTRRGFCRRIELARRDPAVEMRLIFAREDGALLGGVTLNNIRRGVTQSCSLGYWIGMPHVRQGYMTEALRTLVPYCFDTLGLHRIEAACLEKNVASQQLLETLGFRREGLVRGYLKIDGAWRDHVLYALLAGDRGP
jgi:ribosomal-protein-alanine N-acetyltransferase